MEWEKSEVREGRGVQHWLEMAAAESEATLNYCGSPEKCC